MDKRTFVTLGLVLGVLAMASPAFANEAGNITVMGNSSTLGDYTVTYLNTTQLNATIKSSQNTWYRHWFNVSFITRAGDSTASVSITYINFTLPDTWVDNATTSVRLYNASYVQFLEAANHTHTEDQPDYGRVRFNLTSYNYTYPGTSDKWNVTIANDTGLNFAIEFKLDTLDTHKSEATTSSGIHKTINTTYPAPSNVSLQNVSIYLVPSDFSDWDTIKSANYNDTTIYRNTDPNAGATFYTMRSTDIKLDPTQTFAKQYNKTFLKFEYTIQETGHGGSGAGRTSPAAVVTPTPAPSALVYVILAIAGIIAAGGVTVAILLWKYK